MAAINGATFLSVHGEPVEPLIFVLRQAQDERKFLLSLDNFETIY